MNVSFNKQEQDSGVNSIKLETIDKWNEMPLSAVSFLSLEAFKKQKTGRPLDGVIVEKIPMSEIEGSGKLKLA